jgi:hypothetical protein
MSIKKLFSTKKALAIGGAVALTLGLAGGAFAYFTASGSGTGTGSVGTTGTWAVGTVVLAGTTIYPGQDSNAIVSDTVQNAGNGNQNLGSLVVSITSVAQNAGFVSAGTCTTADFALTASSNWTVAAGNESASVTTLSSPTDITAGNYYVNGTGNSPTTGNALPSGLALTMVDGNYNQNGCQDATVTLTLSAS